MQRDNFPNDFLNFGKKSTDLEQDLVDLEGMESSFKQLEKEQPLFESHPETELAKFEKFNQSEELEQPNHVVAPEKTFISATNKNSSVFQEFEQLENERMPIIPQNPSPSDRPPLVQTQEYTAGEIIVKLKPGLQTLGVNSVQASVNASTLAKTKTLGMQLWKLSGGDVENAIATLKKDPRIEYAEPNYKASIDGTPNDPSFNELWGLNNTGQTGGTPDADIDAVEAWDIETGSSSVVVGVIDTGVDYNHPDLAGNIWTNQAEAAGSFGVDDDGNGYIDDIHGYDFVNNDGDPYDDEGHGTHVAGTIAAMGDNGIGVTGVNWDAQIMGLKFLGADGSGSTFGAIQAVEYATQMGVKLTNNSWGGGGYSQALYDAIAAAGDAGQLFIASAGNSSQDNDYYPNYPSSYDLDNIVAVAATDHNDNLTSFSHYGATSVDLGAPGQAILSTVPGGGYASYSGTSMAAPHVAGVASLLWAQNPSRSAEQVKNRLLASVDPIPALVGKTVAGGRLNAFRALTQPATGTISGTKWNDLNGNGLRDVNEPGLPNWTIYLDRDNNGVYNPGWTINVGSYDVPKSIPDVSTTSSVLNVSGVSNTIVDINVNLDITHTWDSDLDVFLVSPLGTSVELFTDVGIAQDNFSGTTLDDEAASSITTGTAPFSGSFKPEGLLSALDGENPNGAWTLQITDDGGGDVGTLNSWSLDITYGDLGAITDVDGSYSFTNLPVGFYTVREELQPGWTQTAPANSFYNLTLNPNDVLSDINFGNKAIPGQIHGRKWNDQNGNGIQDVGESNLAGWTIYLDANKNGILNPGEISTTTNANGEYSFNNLVPGEYTVAEVMQPGWKQTNPGFNGSFEAGNFGGWQLKGNRSIETSGFGANPVDGTYQGLLTTESSSVSDSDLETFLGLGTGSLDALIGGNATEGSALKKTITVSAGQQLSFNWNFLTNEAIPSTYYNDFAFVSISSGPLSKLADTNSSFTSSSTSFSQETGYSTFSHTFSTAGTYTVSVGVLDVYDTSVHSGLFVDNFTLTGGTGNLNSSIPVLIQPASVFTDINFGNRRLTATVGNDFLVGTPANDSINGLAGNDTIIGAAGNDTLIGGPGNDSMAGGLGNDLYNVDSVADIVVEAAGGGIDTIVSSVSRSLGAEQENLSLGGVAAINGFGNALANRIIGNGANNNLSGGVGNDTLIGGAGNDTLIGGPGSDSMAGGLGNDLYNVDSAADIVVEAAGGGIDSIVTTVSRTLGTEEEHLTLGGTAAINGFGNALANRIIGNGANNNLAGGLGNDTLIGGAGNDTHNGGLGSDSMAGGLGNDLYNVDISTDIVVEAAGGGIDTVISTVSRLLGAEQENLILGGTAAISGFGNTLANRMVGNAANNNLVGNTGNDTLIGNGGNDTLVGGTGSDSMVGGLGNDLYNIDSVADIIVEAAGGGIDTIISTVSRTLGVEQENLTLSGIAVINGFGNTLANRIIGNAANNNLAGGAANDTLIGNGGNDNLNGGLGSDRMDGGLGNDIYVADVGTDLVLEAAGGGIDTVISTVSRLLGAEQENLTLAGTAAINGFGNGLGNRIAGNGSNNNLVGDAGNDTIIGGAGNDTLNSGAGNDSLIGSAGSDRFLYTGAAFTTSSVGVDTITDFISGTTGDKLILDKTTFTSLNSIAGTGFSVAGEFKVVASDAAAATSMGEIVYNSVNGKLFYNPNGAGAGFSNVAGAGGLFAILANAPTVLGTDFLIQN